jgi:hypothetical protein
MLRRALTGVRAQALRAASVGPLAHEPPLRHLPLRVEANPPWSGASCGACAASCSAQLHALTASSLRSLRVAGRCIASAAASAASAVGDGRAAAQRRGGRQGLGCAAASSSLVRHCPACWSHGPGRCGGHAARRCARGHGVAQREWLGTLLPGFCSCLSLTFVSLTLRRLWQSRTRDDSGGFRSARSSRELAGASLATECVSAFAAQAAMC